MGRRLLCAFLVMCLMAVVSAPPAAAESDSVTILGQGLWGSTSTDNYDEFGPYSVGVSWRTGCCGSFTYMSARSIGYNDDLYWHEVWDDIASCGNCNITDSTFAYRCGWEGCGINSYVTTRHYFESSAIAGSATLYTSHDGSHSTSSCWNIAGC
jgi:hypothetical protein